MAVCLLGLGSNLGDRSHQLTAAVQRLSEDPHVAVRATSRWYSTSAVGGPADQPDYLNGAVLIDTTLALGELFARIQRVEQLLGRQRAERWGKRLIDIDLLLYDELVWDAPELQVPHPWMAVRRFVLQPAAEIAPDMRHPLLGWNVGQMMAHVENAPPRFALTGAVDSGVLEKLAELASAVTVADPVLLSLGREKESSSGLLLRATDSGPGRAEAEEGTRLEWPSGHLEQSARPFFVRQIEFLDWRHRRLTASPWVDSARTVISQFWWDESRLAAHCSLDQPEQELFEQQFVARAATIVPPKLLIGWLGRGLPPVASASGLNPDRYGRMWRADAQAARAYPWLEIRGTEPERFLQEAAAAIVSMQ
jgi:2-amino-4-hydroxy-6-hydroxymethyldihydropteridine diphosphokinase